jgi:formate dehydrogenase major subunit
MVNFTIDGKYVEVSPGTTVLNAAKGNGIEIPTLCDFSHLEPFGGCRLCVVEVEGVRNLQTSCTLQVRENMVIHTDTEKVRAARKFILTMLFSDRNHLCPYCVVNTGDCELQQAAYKEEMTHWPLQPFWNPMEIDASHEYFVRDPNRCIMCRRCVRSCGELVGNYTLDVKERGAQAQIIADLGSPLGDSTCISCGTCVQICPTGSFIDRWSAYRGQLDDLEETSTICIGCSLGCGIKVLTSDNHLVRIEGNWEAPVNEGLLCKTGRFQPLDEYRERIMSPLVRKNGEMVPETWDKALEMVAERLKPSFGEKDGDVDGIAAMVSTRLPVEAIDFFKEVFAVNLGSSMVTSTEKGKFTSTQIELSKYLGKPLDGSINVINDADCVILINSDLKIDHEVISFFIKRNMPKGQKLIIIDKLKNHLAGIAANELCPTNGSISDVLKCLLAAMTELEFTKSNPEDQPKDYLKKSSAKVGIETETFYHAANTIGAAKNPIIISGEWNRFNLNQGSGIQFGCRTITSRQTIPY